MQLPEGVKFLVGIKDGHYIGFRTKENVVVKLKLPAKIDCPMCQGTGMDSCTLRSWRAVKKCPLCEGRTWVVMLACRNCGRPAWLAAEGGPPCCGRKGCLQEILPKAKRHYETFGGGQHWGPGGPAQWHKEGDRGREAPRFLPGAEDENDDKYWQGYCC